MNAAFRWWQARAAWQQAVAGLVLAVVIVAGALSFTGEDSVEAAEPPSPPAAGASSSAHGPDPLPPGWTNAVEECDCLFGE
jgi:hypothetical protein